MSEEVKEEWRDVVGFEGKYLVSSLGRIKKADGTMLKLTPNKKGYLTCMLRHSIGERRQKCVMISRIVAEAFLDDWDPSLQVDHICIEDVADNRVSNLRMRSGVNNGSRHSKVGKTSKYHGVSYVRGRNYWTAEIHQGGRRIWSLWIKASYDDHDVERRVTIARNDYIAEHELLHEPNELSDLEDESDSDTVSFRTLARGSS